jgi:hypothetical protein
MGWEEGGRFYVYGQVEDFKRIWREIGRMISERCMIFMDF